MNNKSFNLQISFDKWIWQNFLASNGCDDLEEDREKISSPTHIGVGTRSKYKILNCNPTIYSRFGRSQKP